jgi:hypothetical protein
MIKFYKGNSEKYDATKHSDGIYFATDKREIYTDSKESFGKTYVGSDSIEVNSDNQIKVS